MNSPDMGLLSRIASGDQQAFGEIYDQYSAQVMGLLVRLLGQCAEAEDVLQEVFLQIWRSARQYDPERASPRVWIFLIARSRATDRLRRRQYHNSLPSVEPAEIQDPGSEIERSESAGQVREALQRLPESQRSAICLAFYGGHSYESVAREQEVPVGTVKTRIRLGMKQLRSILSKTLKAADHEAKS